MKRLLVVLFVLTASIGDAQSLSAVKKDVAILCSDEFAGRGYVEGGMALASDYLQNRLKEIGVEPYSDSFVQSYGFRVNTFPKVSRVIVDGIALKEGYDFIIDPRSGGFKGRVRPIRIDSAHIVSGHLPDMKKREVALIDPNGIDTPEEVALMHELLLKLLQERPVIRIQEKLTWSVGRSSYDYPLLEVLRSALPEAVEKCMVDVYTEEKDFLAENIIGKISGERSDSLLVFTAHYDHLGKMGDAVFAGASDNASGTAMVLDLAAYYAKSKPRFDTYFIFFSGEEAGLLGSRYFVDHPAFDLGKVKLLINLDLMGSAEKGITIVNGRLHQDLMSRMAKINKEMDLVPKIKLRGKAANSDHYWFYERGVPAIFIYTEGNVRAYHDVYDLPSGLDWANYEEVFTLILKFTESL